MPADGTLPVFSSQGSTSVSPPAPRLSGAAVGARRTASRGPLAALSLKWPGDFLGPDEPDPEALKALYDKMTQARRDMLGEMRRELPAVFR